MYLYTIIRTTCTRDPSLESHTNQKNFFQQDSKADCATVWPLEESRLTQIAIKAPCQDPRCTLPGAAKTTKDRTGHVVMTEQKQLGMVEGSPFFPNILISGRGEVHVLRRLGVKQSGLCTRNHFTACFVRRAFLRGSSSRSSRLLVPTFARVVESTHAFSGAPLERVKGTHGQGQKGELVPEALTGGA
jgi:hypothetical protein